MHLLDGSCLGSGRQPFPSPAGTTTTTSFPSLPMLLLRACPVGLPVQMDYAALDAQIAEKKERAAAAKEQERRDAEEADRIRMAVAAHEEAAQQERERRARQLAIDRERHLVVLRADPDRRALSERAGGISAEARMGAGPSSGLVFDGEDLRAPERAALQAAQMREWGREQAEERARRAREEKEEEERFAAFSMRAAEAASSYERDASNAKRQRAAALARENAALAEAARVAREEERRAEAAGPDTRSMLPAGLGEERVEDGDASATLGPGRIRRDHFRGMSEEQLHRMRVEQARQSAEAEAAQRRARAAAERDEEDRREEMRGVARYEAAAAEEKRRRQQEHLAALQRQMADEQRRKQDERKMRMGLAGGADMTDDFFGKFGQSDR